MASVLEDFVRPKKPISKYETGRSYCKDLFSGCGVTLTGWISGPEEEDREAEEIDTERKDISL